MPEPQSPLLRHPIRWTGAFFLGLMIWVFAFLPFMPNEIWAQPEILVLTAIGYNIGLAFFGVGFVLAIPSKWFNWWLAFVLIGMALEFLSLGFILLLCQLSLKGSMDSSHAFRILDRLIRPLYWFSKGLIVLVSVIPIRGWIDYVRWRSKQKLSSTPHLG